LKKKRIMTFWKFLSLRIYFVHLLTIAIFLGQTSCISYKNLTYFGEESDAEAKIFHELQRPQEYVIKINDNLYVSIMTSNPELNAIYNPAVPSNMVVGMGGGGGGGGTAQNYGSIESQYLNGYLVNANGFIELPIIGRIHVDGLTLPEAEEKIRLRAIEFLKEPSVKVKLLSFKVTVLGEVTTPGIYYNYNISFNVLDAISMANGNTDVSNISKIRVLRQTQAGLVAHRMDFQTYDFLSSEAFYIQPDDVIYVEPAKYKNISLKAPVITLILTTITSVILVASFIQNQR
jgi:polysaccharide biosynthesis/export protein